MIIITGSAQLQNEHREAGIRLGCEHSARSRQEDGCLAHNCHVDAEDPNRVHFFEKWRDMAAVQAHFAVPASTRFVQDITAISVTAPVIEIFDAKAVGG